MPRRKRASQYSLSSLLVLVLVALPRAGRAEEGRAVDPGATTGYELALHGAVITELGNELRLQGVAYEVEGLSTLRPRQGLQIDVALTARQRQGNGRETLVRASSTAGAEGRFEVSLNIPRVTPAAPLVEITLRRRGQPGRTFAWSLRSEMPHHLDLLTDRNRYEPGEKVRSWVRVTKVRGGEPLADATVKLSLTDGAGRPAGERQLVTKRSGAVSFEMTLPESATDGHWQVRAEVIAGATATAAERSIQVTRRTVERLQAEITIDQELVSPGAAITGRVTVRDPAGAPVRRAQVTLLRGAGDPLTLETDAEGVATFRTEAPAFLSGDVATEQLEARVVHAAHGTIRAVASYTVTRVAWMVEATPGAGGLVPELDSELFLNVSDPRGRPIGEGTKVRVRGAGLPGGQIETTTDARGLAQVTVTLPRGAAARRDSGECAGSAATSFEVEVMAEQPITARLCVPVAVDALVLPRAARPLSTASTGNQEGATEIVVEVQRRPAAAGRPVLIEALWRGGRTVASTWIDGRQDEATLTLPRGIQGVIEIRARPAWPSDRTRPLDEPGATALGVGAITAVLVRPDDTFPLEVRPTRELWRIQERAQVRLAAARAPRAGWAALLVRDQAALGGEDRWQLEWIEGELREAIQAGDDPGAERFLRLALAAGLSPDRPQVEPPPLVTPPWANSRSTGSYQSGQAAALGVLRDPLARREELLRRGLAPVTRTLEQVISGLGSDDRAREGIVRQAGKRQSFHPAVIANLVAARRLSTSQARTLGGEPLTVAMITAADPSFTFDAVARRVGRARLVRLLQALVRFSDPDDESAARASAGEPPARWLSRLVQLGMVEAEALVDPWGRPFTFRRVTGRQPEVVVSDRAVDFELASPGPDGVLGNADDLRDPFERAVAQGTPYAVSSGEDALQEQLSRVAPGSRVLASMVLAYQRLALAAEEERRRGPVEATGSEDLQPAFEAQLPASTVALDALGGLAAAGEDMRRAEGRAMAREREQAEYELDEDGAFDSPTPLAQAASREPMAPPPPPAPARPGPGGSLAQALGATVREDFPATLFFLGEVPLDPRTGQAEVEVPLADALTTYRLEAIAWTSTGWITSAMSRLRVDQEAMVDAPVPPFATVGDHLRLPVRVANRTDAPLPVRLEIEAEGDLGLGAQEPITVEVPPREAVESIIDVRLGTVGEGALVITAVHAREGRPLDAVRRPLLVWADVRLAREVREELIEAGAPLIVEVPAEASERGPGELRLAVGSGLFGEPAVWGEGASYEVQLWAAWAMSASGAEVPEALRESMLSDWIPDDAEEEWYLEPQEVALALTMLWGDERMSDEIARAGLRTISQGLPSAEEAREDEILPEASFDAAWLLLALSPTLEAVTARPELREDLERITDQLRRAVSAQAAAASEAPVVWAQAAASLALSQPGEGNARAQEMLRRAERHIIEVGDESWLEPSTTTGAVIDRVEPTALLALALLTSGGPREGALSLLRSLVRVVRSVDSWSIRGRAVASAAAAMLATSDIDQGQVTVTLDGAPVEIQRDAGAITAVLSGLGRPGRHTIDVRMAPGQVALAWLDIRYGLPWSVNPRSEAPVELTWTGPAGARDGRAGLRLEVRNRGVRILTRPIVEIELPAGTELDEPTREALEALLSQPASVEGRTLRLNLRPLAPGGYVRLPLRLRWAVGGTIIGLGATLWDDSGPTPLAARPSRVLPSRGVEIADRGAEPEAPEAEASPPPIEPRPLPLPPISPLAEEVL